MRASAEDPLTTVAPARPADTPAGPLDRPEVGDPVSAWRSEDFTAFFEVAYPEAIRLAQRMGLRTDDAQDAALEALTRTYVSWAHLRHVDWKRPWVARVVANLAIDVHRRRAPAPLEPPEQAFEGQAVARMDLLRALAKLPRRQRQVAILRYCADLPIETVSAALRLRPSTVKKHTARAVAALRADLGVDSCDEHRGG